MLNSVTNYFYERRRGFVKAAGVAGGVYLVGRYVGERLRDMRDKVVQERAARENVRKRFQQNLQDISFTIMAHLPMLANHILTEMDVESLTAELSSLSKAAKAPPPLGPPPPPITEPLSSSQDSSLESSMELVRESDAHSDNGSVSVVSFTTQDEASSSLMAGSHSSWVRPFSGHSPQGSDASPAEQNQLAVDATATDRHALSDSGMTSSVVSSNGESSLGDLASSQMSIASRSKAELWREVKILSEPSPITYLADLNTSARLAVTRTLTVMYSMTLLSVFTNIQLSLLGRYKYVQSVMQLEREEEERSSLISETSIASLFFASPRHSFDIESLLFGKGEWEDDSIWREGVDEETERKYLTLSWWILNVGWKDVGERVRRAVEEVFEGVSLKGKLGPIELHRLISDVRRRVEHEVTFEGIERRINFVSTLLPPTSSALAHLLTRGGFPPSHSDVHEPAFTTLLEETRDLLASSDFMVVLERSLDRATEVLFDGLSNDVFGGPGGEEGDDVRLRFASVLPGLARWSSLTLNGLPNVLVDSMADLHEVAAFAAIIYSNYEDRFW
ncbi:hypothetical protein BV25DRAFT_1917083 [Artomyces pyxidatus]|uniref:Uncharacterized protein n=1 Tax=Artomyces pyxidatus TaxID=48021 RepID=A0ACB8SXI8_9AGAM|nr:hypothetical protein BV25DRAFT_1917083 [Artomyces pyxidatus]